ncbi:hypothetical protein V3C99_009353 [Haemonchus contortus]
MTRRFSTSFGEPLSDESQRYVNEVRSRITQPISSTFNTDFNIYRFVMSAERLHKKEKDIVDAAAKALNNHLRIRKALDLDNQPVRGYDENPMFAKKLMPRGEILNVHDAHNRLLWYIEYATITVESIAHAIQSSQACKYQFWQFENMLRKVMAQVTPVDIVNIARWIHVPYKIAKTMMPAGFSDKFRLHDSNFLKALTEDIDLNNIPTTLGGNNESITCIGAEKLQPCEYWTPENSELLHHLEHLHIPAKKTRYITLEISEPKTLSWYFRTDGDIYFGVFYESKHETKNEHHLDTDSMDMIYPWLKLSAKLVHEKDSVDCQKSGRYHIVFCNKHSWLSRRTIDHYIHITDQEGNSERVHSDGNLSAAICW